MYMKDNCLKSNGFLSLTWLFAALFLMVVMVVSSVSAQAQNKNFTNILTLKSDQGHYKLAPHIYVTRDSGKPLNFDNYKKFVDSHLAGNKGNRIEGNILNLGAASMPHWIVFAVNNQSEAEKWFLSFGQHMDGRIGLVEDVFVYDHVSKKTYINTLSSSKSSSLKDKKLKGAALALDIPRGKETLVFIYVVPKPGMPTTLVPELMTEGVYMNTLTGSFNQTQAISFFFILVAGIFLATVLFRKMWDSIFFILYYMVLLAFFRYQNDFLQMDFVFASQVPGIFFNLSILLGLLMSKSFLKIGKLLRFQSRLIAIFSFMLIFSTLGAVIFIPDDSVLEFAFLYFMPLLALLFLFMLSLAHGYTEHPEGYHLAAGWLVVFAGACATFVSLMNIFTPPLFLINSYWYALIIQGVLFITAVMTRLILEARAGAVIQKERQREQESVKDITSSKESSENARLLRMIEHERQVMTELRDREAQQNEEMRKAREGADQANNAKSAFLAVVSHEIRTPMSGIMGMVRFLLETPLNKEQKGYAQTLQDSGDAMLSLLNDILDFEKIESGNMDLEYIDFDLQRLVQGIKTLMSGHAETKNIYLKAELDPAVPRYVIGDSIRLRQVLLNLAGNSIKFTGEGGVTIHVKPDPAVAGEGSDKKTVHRIRFAIEDTGVGISKEAQENLFNPFSQADSSVARKFGGTGLGLAISQKLIEAMGGQIEINSTEGHGSTFFFTLVMEEGSAAAVESAESSGTQVSQKPAEAMKILIVEDNEINQKLMRELVDRMGHETSVAGSGEEALEIAGENDLDMILMDIQLPGMTGMGTTKAIRALEHPERASVPVVALTGNVQEKDVRDCYAANMNGHLAKPVDPKKLKDQISKVFEGRLDNPVEVSEEKIDKHTEITQLNVGTEKFGADVSDDLIQTESDEDMDLAQSDDVEEYVRKPEEDVAPIMASLEESDTSLMDISEEELDEDSFEEALEISEGKNGVKTIEVFDRMMLDALRGNLGDEQFNTLLQDMLVKAEDILKEIKGASDSNDVPAISARAHELKGMAGNFGFTEISALAAKIELAVKENQTGGVHDLLPGLLIAHDRAKVALQEWMESSSPAG